MTETADLHISAFADNELSRDECEFLVRRLSRDAEARGRLLRYATIGAAMRGELLGPDPDVLRRRIGAALEGVHLPARSEAPAKRRLRRLTRPAVGAGIAASVAVAALLAIRMGGEGARPEEPAVVAADPVPGQTFAEGELLPSYIVPAGGTAERQTSIALTDYLVQHNQFTPAIRRASLNSMVVGEQQWRALPAPQPEE